MDWRDLLLYALLLWFCGSWVCCGLLWAALRVTRHRHPHADEVTEIGEKIVIVSRCEAPLSRPRTSR